MPHVVMKQNMKVNTAMEGIDNHTGRRGFVRSPLTNIGAILLRKKRCMRYMPNDKREARPTSRGVLLPPIQLNIRKAPKVAISTFGVQNSHDHSSIGVSMVWPGTPTYQKDHPVKAAPVRKHAKPIFMRLGLSQLRWKRM